MKYSQLSYTCLQEPLMEITLKTLASCQGDVKEKEKKK